MFATALLLPAAAVAEEPLRYALWAPEPNVRSTVADGSGAGGRYNHAPTVARDAAGDIVVLWNGNPGSAREGAPGQVIYQAASTDGGTSWSVAVTPFNDARHAENPVLAGPTQWQPAVLRVGNELWAFWNQSRFGPHPGTYLSRRAAGRRWHTEVLCRDTQRDAIEWCDASQPMPAGRSPFVLVEGRPAFLFPQHALVTQDGRVLVAATAIGTTGSFETAPKRFVVLSAAKGTWELSGAAPLGVLADPDPFETALAETAPGFVAVMRRNDPVAPVGSRIALSTSLDGREWSPPAFLPLALHRERPWLTSVPGFTLLLLPDSENRRENQAIFPARTGAAFLPGLSIVAPLPGRLTHYASASFDPQGRRLLLTYAEGPTGGSAPQNIRFARLDTLPPAEHLLVVPRANAAHVFGQSHAAVPEDGARVLSLQGAASAGVETPPRGGTLSLRAEVSAVPQQSSRTLLTAGIATQFISIDLVPSGNLQRLALMLRRGSEAAHEIARGPSLVPGEPASLVLSLSAGSSEAVVFDRKVALPSGAQVYLGPGFPTRYFTGETAAVRYDVRSMAFVPAQ